MKIKVAIIDPIGSHGSSHHYYLFAQAKGLIENKVDVTIFSNKKTYLSSLGKIKVENTFGDIFKTKGKLANAIFAESIVPSRELPIIEFVELFRFISVLRTAL